MELETMGRPKKWRRVCDLPETDRFGPLDPSLKSGAAVRMDVEEYETIRLIDGRGLTQEECATHMKVARTTVQSIYNNARTKIAESLIQGKPLIIEGGMYQLCDGTGENCGGMHCARRKRKHSSSCNRARRGE